MGNNYDGWKLQTPPERPEDDEMRKCYDCNKYFLRFGMKPIDIYQTILGEEIKLLRYVCAKCSKNI